MTNIDGTTGTQLTATSTAGSGLIGSGGTTSASGSTSSLIGPNAFLQLMMTQLEDQDPLNPQDPSQYLSELAQMTSVEQETNTAQSVQLSAAEQAASTAVGLLNDTVTYTDSSGNPQTGTVQSVQFTSAGPTLTINGTAGISPSSVTGVS